MIVNMLIFISTDPWYMEVGELIVDSLNLYARVEGGFASIRDVTSMELEDHQHSFFLSETWVLWILKAQYLWLMYSGHKHEPCSSIFFHFFFFLIYRCKYLYLLYDDSFLGDRNYIFTTEGHPLPVLSSWREKLPEAYIPSNWTYVKVLVPLSILQWFLSAIWSHWFVLFSIVYFCYFLPFLLCSGVLEHNEIYIIFIVLSECAVSLIVITIVMPIIIIFFFG